MSAYDLQLDGPEEIVPTCSSDFRLVASQGGNEEFPRGFKFFWRAKTENSTLIQLLEHELLTVDNYLDLRSESVSEVGTQDVNFTLTAEPFVGTEEEMYRIVSFREDLLQFVAL